MEGRVLVIDDDPGVRKALQRILTGAGYEFEEAGDAFQALEALDAKPPDAALLDIKMPGMDGLGLLENLQQRGSTPPQGKRSSCVAPSPREGSPASSMRTRSRHPCSATARRSNSCVRRSRGSRRPTPRS